MVLRQVFEFLKKFMNIKTETQEKDYTEIAGQVAANILSSEPTYPSIQEYLLLEDERISREIWGYALAFVTRDAALSYLSESDIQFLFFKTEALGTWIDIALNSIIPSPRYYDSLTDYVKEVYGKQLLSENLRIWMYLRVKRSYRGFERTMMTKKIVTISMGRGE